MTPGERGASPRLPASLASSSAIIAARDWSSRIPALDGLRGIAILLVLLHHSVFAADSSVPISNRLSAIGLLSWSGVDLFFVLSGFLIGGILFEARESPRYYATFYARRAYRILPLYFAVTTLFLMRHLVVRLLPGALGDTSPLTIPWESYLSFTQNFFMAHLGRYGPQGLVVTWSLAVEEQFYLVIPLIIRKIRAPRLVWVLIFVVVAAPFLRLLLYRTMDHGGFASYVLMPCRADALCLGVLSAYLVRRPAFWHHLVAGRQMLGTAICILFLGTVFMTFRHYDYLSLPMITLGYSWLALFFTSCLLMAVSSSDGMLHNLLCNPLLVRLGTLAYCTYLLHDPLIKTGTRVFGALMPYHPQLAWLAGGLSAIAVTLAMAAISWRVLEKPMLRRGHKYQY